MMLKVAQVHASFAPRIPWPSGCGGVRKRQGPACYRTAPSVSRRAPCLWVRKFRLRRERRPAAQVPASRLAKKDDKFALLSREDLSYCPVAERAHCYTLRRRRSVLSAAVLSYATRDKRYHWRVPATSGAVPRVPGAACG